MDLVVVLAVRHPSEVLQVGQVGLAKDLQRVDPVVQRPSEVRRVDHLAVDPVGHQMHRAAVQKQVD